MQNSKAAMSVHRGFAALFYMAYGTIVPARERLFCISAACYRTIGFGYYLHSVGYAAPKRLHKKRPGSVGMLPGLILKR